MFVVPLIPKGTPAVMITKSFSLACGGHVLLEDIIQTFRQLI